MTRGAPPAVQQLALAPGQTPAELLQQVTKRRRRHKFNAVRTGRYASKAEARYAEMLRAQKIAGVIADWLEQVPIRLSGDIVYRADFMVLYHDGSVRFVEVKGYETPEWKFKYRLLRSERPEIFARLEVVR